jgi:hypothetical protein
VSPSYCALGRESGVEITAPVSFFGFVTAVFKFCQRDVICKLNKTAFRLSKWLMSRRTRHGSIDRKLNVRAARIVNRRRSATFSGTPQPGPPARQGRILEGCGLRRAFRACRPIATMRRRWKSRPAATTRGGFASHQSSLVAMQNCWRTPGGSDFDANQHRGPMRGEPTSTATQYTTGVPIRIHCIRATLPRSGRSASMSTAGELVAPRSR